MNPLYWLAILAVLLIIEAATMALTTIWFAGGALIAYLVSLFCDNLTVQFIVFFVCSVALLLFLRPSALKRFNRRRAKTNVDSAIGKTVRVTEEVNNYTNTGRADLAGMEWAARSFNDRLTFPAGTLATVARVEGVKLIIQPKED
ncbi:MAG: NfeD family protein [Lachnospiraceae bacterium]|nr:NfeD family protein [Lachnospiraceae bacterium]